MQSMTSGLTAPLMGLSHNLLLGIGISLLAAMGLAEATSHVSQPRPAAPVVTLSGATNVFQTSERRAEWETIAPTLTPTPVFASTEAAAEWGSLQPRTL